MTRFSRWARARWGCRIQCPTVAAMTPISNRPASTHTTTAKGRNPGTRTGRPAAAVATIEVPITDANQLGPTAASASRRSSRAARKPRPGERPSVGRRRVVVGGSEVAVTGRASAARPAPDHPGSTDCGWPLARPSLISPAGWWRIARTPLDQSRGGTVREHLGADVLPNQRGAADVEAVQVPQIDVGRRLRQHVVGLEFVDDLEHPGVHTPVDAQ